MKFVFWVLIAFLSCSTWADELYINNIAGDCGNVYSYHAVFDVLAFNCAQGYFLPAGALSCVACPDGYTCDGGTFEFNVNVTQGLNAGDILLQNAVGSCGDDFTRSFHAIYEPNTVNLNFDDGNGNVTSMTCEYGDTIVIPENVPTRTGYNFAGWVVRQQSNE